MTYITYIKYILHVEGNFFMMTKSDKDPDPYPHLVGSLDPDPH